MWRYVEKKKKKRNIGIKTFIVDKVNVLKFDLKKILSWEHEHIAQRTDNLLNVKRITKDLRPLKYQLPEMSTEQVELKLDRLRLADSKYS